MFKLKKAGVDVMGIELNPKRAHYVKSKHDINVEKKPIESEYRENGYSGHFDAVTLWDVIEHVNYPLKTLRASVNVLREKGLVFIDTPCRDSFYHRFGQLSYSCTSGRYPTFLNTIYSSHQFGHKQIFSTSEIEALSNHANLEILELKKFHELSFPYRYYLKRLFRSNLIAALLLPLVHAALRAFPIKNKMSVIGKKIA